jgi:hypothetical protein
MKKIFYALCFAIAMQGCKPEVNYKAVRQEVITLHDQLMADEGRAMNAKMTLDTLALKPGAANMRNDIAALGSKLTFASDEMSKWMENFTSDVTGKSNAEAVAYFEQEKVKVKKLDSLYKTALSQAAIYLKKFNVKPDTVKHHEHSMHM